MDRLNVVMQAIQFFGAGTARLLLLKEIKHCGRNMHSANASIGINGSVLNNVNASQLMLTPDYLKRVKAIAEIFRPYGVKVYLSVKFTSPALLGGLKTSDPLKDSVINWWKAKAKEIYSIIPDFGGFLVKASSEGQPGPQDYGRTHADGATCWPMH